MGVMRCSRNNCDNIMCDTYVDSVGYVCDECKSEFKEYLNEFSLNPKTEGQIIKELKVFMVTSKNTFSDGKEITVDEFLRNVHKTI